MYETGWTERYSGPFDEDVFKRGDAAKNAKNLTGKLLLAYGALDDNVSASETIRLCDILNRLNKDYDLMVCPRINHNVPELTTTLCAERWITLSNIFWARSRLRNTGSS